jgi:hypothetical protein
VGYSWFLLVRTFCATCNNNIILNIKYIYVLGEITSRRNVKWRRYLSQSNVAEITPPGPDHLLFRGKSNLEHEPINML